jgi:hypothetical protein
VSAKDHATAFSIWAFAIHLDQLSKVRHSLTPNNAEMQSFYDKCHPTCIHSPLLHTPANMTDPGENLAVFKHLSKGLKQKQEKITLKEREKEKKKDRIKDMHPSILNMIRMASAMKADHIGEFCNSFKSFYNSKNQGYADLELHNQFKDKALQNVGFAEGTVLPLWSGLRKQSNPTAPSNCSPLVFKELTPINMNQKSRSLIITMINQKGGLSQRLDKIKAKAKQDIAASSDYHEMVFQLKAFLALLDILFGNKTIVAKKIREFVKLIIQNSIYYKGCLCNNKLFSTKVLWMVCCRFQLFLACCQKAEDREEVAASLLNFAPNHRDIMMGRFNASLLPLFKVVGSEERETNNNDNKDKRTTKKRKSNEKKRSTRS